MPSWPSKVAELRPEVLLSTVFNRVSISEALWSAVAPFSTFNIVLASETESALASPLPEAVLPINVSVAISCIFAKVTALLAIVWAPSPLEVTSPEWLGWL